MTTQIEVGTKSFTELQDGYSDKLGLVLLGAGGDPHDWITGLSDLLVKKCDATLPVFSEAFLLTGNVKGSDGRTDLVLVFPDDTNINVGKLAMFRIQFGDASWIDDFICNHSADYGVLSEDDDYEEDDE